MMRALITGGAGFIGSHLADHLLAHGWQVTVLDNLSTGKLANIAPHLDKVEFGWVHGNVLEAPLVRRLVSGCDVVFHLAATVGVKAVLDNPAATILNNLGGTENVLEAAYRHGKRVVLASTSEVYGKSEALPYREDGPRAYGPTTATRWCYAESKALDEVLALDYARRGLPVTIARLFNTVGPRQSAESGMVLPRLVRQALAGEPLTVYGTGTQTRCFCHVTDVVRALILLATSPHTLGEIYNVGNDQEVSINELAAQVKEINASPSRIVHVDYDAAYGPGFDEMPRRVPCLDKIEAAIGWMPRRGLGEIIADVSEYAEQAQEALP